MLLTTGEKIRIIRKNYKITQKKLSDGICSEQFLSQVEKNKKNFSEKSLEKIWNKMKIIVGKEIEKKYSLEFLKESKEKQLEKLIIKWIKEIKLELKIDFYEVENFFKNNDYAKEKIIIYNCIGKYYCKNKNHINANYYYSQILDEELLKYNKPLFLAILLKILRNNYFLKNFSKSIVLYKNCKNVIDTSKNKILLYIYYNVALSMMENENFLESIKLFKKVIFFTNKSEIIYRAKNNIAYCLQEMGKYDEARTEWNKLIKEFNSSNSKVLDSLINIGKCSIKDNNIFIMENSIRQIEDFYLKNNLKKLSFKRNYTIGNILEKLKLKNQAIEYYQQEIKLGFILNDSNFDSKIYFKTFNKLLELYDYNDLDKIIKLYKFYLTIPSEYVEIKTTHLLIRKLIEVSKIDLICKINEKFL